MNTTITVGPYYSASSADTAAANYLKQGNSMRLAIESGLAQTLVAAGAGNFKASDVSVVYTEVTRSSRTTWSIYITCEISISTGQVTSSSSATKKRRRYRILLEEESDASAIEGALSSIEASLTAAASSGALGLSLADASSAAGVESVPVSSEVTTTKVAVTKTVNLEASKLTAVKATVESISSRLSLLRSSVERAQINLKENDDIDFEGYLTFNEKAWDASMEASLEEHAVLTAYAGEAFRLLNATVSIQETSNNALISIQERALQLKTALESTLVLLNSMNSGEEEVGVGASCEVTNSCECPKRDKGKILVFFNATKTFTYIPEDFPASPPPPPPPSPPPSPPPVPQGCTAEDIYLYGGCASAKEQKAKGRRLLRDLKYSGAQEVPSSSSSSNILDDDISDELYFGYNVKYKEKKEVKKEISYVPERKIRGKNTLIGGVLITQYRTERASGFNCSNRFPKLISTCRDFSRDSIAPFGVDPIFSRSSRLFGGVELEENIDKYYNISELPASGVPNGFSVRSSDLKRGKTGFAVYIDIMTNKKQADRMISYMREGNFIDSSTRSIVVNIAAYNPVTVRFTNTRVTFEYSKGGSIEIKSNTQALAMDVYKGTEGVILLAMEVVIVCWVIYSTYALLADSVIVSRSNDFEILRNMNQARVVQIHSNILEIVNLLFQLGAFVTWWAYQALYAYRFSPSKRYDIYYSVSAPSAHFMMPFKNQTGNDLAGGSFVNGTDYKVPIRPKYGWELPEDDRGYTSLIKMYNEIDVMSTLSVLYNLITGVNLLMLFIRFLLLLKFQPRLAIITRTLERASVDVFHFLFMFSILLMMASILGNTMFGASVEGVSSVPMAFELLFLLLIGATSFSEFTPKGFSGNRIDTFFRVFYCGLIPILFQWILFEFFMSILADAFGEEKEILDDIEAAGDTLPNDIKKLLEYKISTRRGEWPRFEDTHDLLKSSIKIAKRSFNPAISSAKRVNRHLSDSDEDVRDGEMTVDELAYVIKKSFPNKATAIFMPSDSDLSESSSSLAAEISIRKFAQKILINKPESDDTNEILKRKVQKVRELKLNAYAELRARIEEVSADLKQHLEEQKVRIEQSENLSVRWKRIREFAEDIEAALEEFGFTKETFDKKKLKIRVKELRESRSKAEIKEKMIWIEAVEKVKKFRATHRLTPISFRRATSLIRRKSRNDKIKRLLKERELYEKPHNSSSANRRHKEEGIELHDVVDRDFAALALFKEMKRSSSAAASQKASSSSSK